MKNWQSMNKKLDKQVNDMIIDRFKEIRQLPEFQPNSNDELYGKGLSCKEILTIKDKIIPLDQEILYYQEILWKVQNIDESKFTSFIERIQIKFRSTINRLQDKRNILQEKLDKDNIFIFCNKYFPENLVFDFLSKKIIFLYDNTLTNEVYWTYGKNIVVGTDTDQLTINGNKITYKMVVNFYFPDEIYII